MINLKSLALFDFDGTITNRDTLLEMVKFSHGIVRFYLGMILLSPVLVLMKLKLLSNQRVKELFLQLFFGGQSVEKFQSICNEFAEDIIPKLVKESALKEIERYKHNGVRVIVVSASPENWVKVWSSLVGVEYVATRLRVENEKITGRIEGANCYGAEKVNRLKSTLDIDGYTSISAYGDSSGDIEMLEIAHNKFYRTFR